MLDNKLYDFREVQSKNSEYSENIPELKFLIAKLLRPDVPQETINFISELGVKRIVDLSIYDLTSLDGIQKADAERLLTAFDLSRFIYHKNFLSQKMTRIECPADAYEYCKDLSVLPQEQIDVLCLNAKNEVVSRKTVFKGSSIFTIVNARDLFREIIKSNALAAIVVHNHPTGHTEPSEDDKKTTKKLMIAGELIGIEIIDHVIVGSNGFTSILEVLDDEESEE